jgi:hypothetical protein
MVRYMDRQRFCSRVCSDAWYQGERREAVEWYRACGMRPAIRREDQQQKEGEVSIGFQI